MQPLVRLGTVANGRSVGGEFAFNKFYVLVSVEAADTVTERHGPLVLRGLSASTRMRDPHFLTLPPPADAALPTGTPRTPRTASTPAMTPRHPTAPRPHAGPCRRTTRAFP
jgi:hypothetical protein